jgi:uncharacterized membrane protein YedE/YeeE
MLETTLILGGLIVGLLFGFVLQRGRFCMNSAIRDIILLKEYTMIKMVALAIVIQMISFHLMASMGIIQLNPKPFYWGAMSVGGFIFGIGMVLGGGCASGTTYRIGEGMVGSLIALLGLMIGGNIMSGDAFKEVRTALQVNTAITATDLGINPGPYLSNTNLTIANVFGVNPWIIVVILCVGILGALVMKNKEQQSAAEGTLYERVFKKGWDWWITGIAIGVTGILAFLSFKKYPLGISGGWFGVLNTVLKGDLGQLNWFSFLVMGTVIGAAIAASIASEFKVRVPKPMRLAQQFIGGLLMGVGAVIGTACNVGHILSGVPQLSLGSLWGGIFIVLGCWVTTYFMFMRE